MHLKEERIKDTERIDFLSLLFHFLLSIAINRKFIGNFLYDEISVVKI